MFSFRNSARIVEALLLQSAAENSIEHGHVDLPAFERLGRHRLIADDQESNLVASRIETQVLQTEHRAHPDGAGKRLNAEVLAAQILGSFDVRRGDDIVAQAVGQEPMIFRSAPPATAVSTVVPPVYAACTSPAVSAATRIGA